jgi:hypothetical protein
VSRRLTGLLIAAASLFGSSAQAQTNATVVRTPPPVPSAAPATVMPTEESRARAFKLAEALNNEAITKRQIDRIYTVTMPAAVKQRADYQEMERLYPGISDVAVRAERAIIEPATIANLPKLHQTIADVYVQYLTSSDIEAIASFYSTPTGLKALEAATEGSDFSHMVDKNMTTGDGKLEASDLTKMAAGSNMKFLSVIDDDDRRKLVAFSLTPAGRKWRTIQPMVFAAVAAQSNQLNSGVLAEATQSVVDAISNYVKTFDAAKSTAASGSK